MVDIIEINKINKTYWRKKREGLFKKEQEPIHALKNINLTVKQGEIFSLLGPNGAGKTTLIKILTTLLLPSSGEAYVLGHNVKKEPAKVRKFINAMLMGERSIYWKLTGKQNLDYFASLYHIPKKIAKERINKLSLDIGLEEFIDRKVETYSSGQKFKLAFAKALINDPPLVFLDEPTATLDPRAAREVRFIIKDLNNKGTTIFLTTHNMYEADQLSDRVAILDLGEIIAIDTPELLKETITINKSIDIEIPAKFITDAKWLQEIRVLPQVSNVAVDQKVNGNNGNESKAIVKITSKEESNLAELINIFENHNIPVFRIQSGQITLEDVFMEKTGRLLSEDTTGSDVKK